MVSQNVETNSSTISFTLTLKDLNGYGATFSSSSSGNIRVGDTTYRISIPAGANVTAKGSLVLISDTAVISHSSTSSQSFTWDYDLSWTLSLVASGGMSFSQSSSGSDVIDAIVRAAYIVALSSSSITDEDSLTLTYSNPSGTYATLLQAGMSLTTTDSNMAIPYRNLTKTGTSYKFTFSSSELSTLYAQVLDKNLTTARLRLFLKSTVPYSGSNTTVTDYRDITITFINYKPTLSITMKDTSLRSLDVTGNDQIYVRGVSDVQFNLGAQVYKGATLKNVWIQNGDQLINTNSGYLTEITSNTFHAYVEDDRGYFAAQEIVLDEEHWIPYFPLTCKVNSALLDANSNIAVTISGKYYQHGFGAKENTMRMEYHVRDDNNSLNDWYSPVRYIEPDVDAQGNYTYSFTISDERIDYRGRYHLEVLAIDEVMTDNAVAATIVGAIPVFDWSGEDFAFYVPVSINEARVPSIVDEGTSGKWTYRKWSDGTAECWASVQFTTNISTAWGNLYSSGAVSSTNLSFPFEFTEIPVVTASLSVISAAALLMPPGGTSYTTTKSQTGAYELVRPNSITNATYRLNYIVRGRWK